MALTLNEWLLFNYVLWEDISKQPELDHLVLCLCEAVTR